MELSLPAQVTQLPSRLLLPTMLLSLDLPQLTAKLQER